MPGDIIIDSLLTFMSTAEIQAAWKEVFTAHVTGIKTDVVITSSSFEGSNVSGLRIAPGERERFMQQCQAAIAQAGGSASDANGIKIDFSSRQVRT